VIVTLAPLQDSFTITNINRCCYKLRLRVCRLFRGFCIHHSRFCRCEGCNGGYGCYAARTILFSSDDYSSGCGGCSHCGRGPHAKAPQSSSRVTGESSYQLISSWSLASTASRRLLRSRIWRRSSRRNSRIASLSCSFAGGVPGGMDVVMGKRTCDW
jgi:hypothetical protein